MPRIYLIYHTRMFADALSAVLGTQPSIELVGMSNSPEQIRTDIATHLPDVILLEETEHGLTYGDVCLFLTSPLAHRLITLRPDQDGMRVWSQIWHRTVRTQDLMAAILTAVDWPSQEDEP